MRSGSKDKKYSFITVVSVCFFLSAFVFPVPVYAAGEIVAWGYNYDGECNVPEPNMGFKAVAAGMYHSLGLKQDGSIVAWGNNYDGQSSVPEPNTDFNAVSAGGYHSLGLKQDGSIVAWGFNDHGECNVPEPNTGFKAIAAGKWHSLGLKQDGSIVAWGANWSGQCTVPEPNTGFVAIAAGGSHSLGLKTDGSIVAWGDNYYGECNVPEPNTGFKAIAASVGHSLGLKTDGSIVAWGYNEYGQCTVPEPNTGFSAIAAGGGHSLGLKTDGSIVAWGYNEYGQCNVPEPNTDFKAIAAGVGHSLGLKGCPYNLVGDISNDCKVDFEDLTILADQWLQPPGTPSADITPPPGGDGIANFLDYATMANNWLMDSTLVYSLEPYVMAWDQNTEKIRLETNHNTTVLIKYGKTPSYGDVNYDPEPNTSHEITLHPLDPNTTYYYRVIATAVESNERLEFHSSFITSDNLKTNFRFGYFGDSRGTNCGDVGDGEAGLIAYQSMLQQMKEKGVAFVILGGDGVQTIGSGEDPEKYNTAWKSFHDCSFALRGDLSIPYLSALGNHELNKLPCNYSQKGKDAFAKYWMHPMNGAGEVNNWEETTFSWRYGNTNFIFLNTEENDNGGKITGEQLEWFENEVNKPGFDNKFVICHRALVGSIRTSCGALQGLDPSMAAYIDNLMYNNGVTAGLYSHEHCYNYSTTHDGNMIHVISGGAGAERRDCSNISPKMEFGIGENASSISDPCCIPLTWHYIIIDVNNSSITGKVYDNNENEIHTFSK